MSTLNQRSFTGGEISPSLYARVDVAKYTTGLRTCRNMIVLKHGGIQNRPGTKFIGETKTSSNEFRLIDFVFNSDQTYVLEFGDQYMRVIHNGGYVTSGGSVYEISTPYVKQDLFDLNYIQSADVITIVHPSYAPRELARTGHAAWTLSAITFSPSVTTPSGVSVSGTSGSETFTYHVTAVDPETFEESLAGTKTQANLTAPATNAHTISWTAISGVDEYNVYLESNGIAGFIGVAGTNTFVNSGTSPDTTDTPPTARNPFSGSGNYPSAVTYYQQRLTFANTENDPEKVFGSRSANFKNFTVSSPVQDDDAVTFSLRGRSVNEVRHLLDLGTLLIFTSGGEWSVEGNDAGVILPTAINPKQRSYRGSSDLRPLVVGNSAIYVQARKSIIRDIFSDLVEGYKSEDLTIFASHLFEGYTIVDWAYQQNPNSIVWVVRSDGALLGLTYLREHQIWAWHKHDFPNGQVETICVVPEGNEDAVYLGIKRTIDGLTVRYVERMTDRLINENTDIKDKIFMDSTLTYDGRNTSATTMTLSGGTTWDHFETLTLTASAGYFVSGDVGNQIHITLTDGSVLRCTIVGYTSTTVVSVQSHKIVPASIRNTATTNWSKAVDEVSGLDHLEGESVSVFADGFVVANPNNDSYDSISVSSGSITLDKSYTVIHVGIPYLSDIETLDIDTVNSETLADKKKIITNVSIYVNKSRGVWVGPKPPTDDSIDPLEDLTEMKLRKYEGYDAPPNLLTEVISVNIKSEWNSSGRVFVRQVDPLPLEVLSIIPSGMIPFRR